MSSIKLRLAVILAIAAVVLACSVETERDVTPSPAAPATVTATPLATITPTATATPTPTPAATPTPTPIKDRSIPPERDLYALAERLVLKSAVPIPRVGIPDPTDYKEGRKDRFNVVEFQASRAHQVTATLHLVTEHAYWYVDDNVGFDAAALKESARVFEEQIRPRITQVLGDARGIGTSSGARLTILHTPVGGGVAGYFSSTDQYPVQVQPYSNQRDMIYLDAASLALGSPSYLKTLAHEFTHAIQYPADPTEETWISEGMAEFGRQLAGYPPTFHSAFLAAPSVSLTVWPEVSGGSAAYYGAASLFMDYLADRFGTQSLRALLEEAANGTKGMEAYLAKVGAGKSFRDVFADWIVANYLNDRGGGVFGYPSLETRVPVTQTVSAPGKISAQVQQYGAGYYDLRLKASQVKVAFQGNKDIPLLPQDPPAGGGCWWSNGGDSIDTTLTRPFQLPSANPLTLDYSLWYALENGWDYAYVEVSQDDGITWDILKGGHASLKENNINAFGPGYTGSSSGWLRDRVDLTPYAGKEVLLRFEYVTDESIHGPGLCVTDIAIPEAGFSDKAGQENGAWDAMGFLWTANRVPQSYVLRVIEMGATPVVRDIPLDENGAGNFTIDGLGTRIDNAVIVVAGVADYTTLPASFQLEVVLSQGN